MVIYSGTVQNGMIRIDGDLDLPEGARIMFTLIEDEEDEIAEDEGISAQDLLNAPFIGAWAERDDIGDSAEFAAKIRRQWEQRLDGPD